MWPSSPSVRRPTGCGSDAIVVVRRSSHCHLRNHRHARTQQAFAIRVGLELNAHGNALHDFHVIAGRIFRRKETRFRSGRATDGRHVSLPIPVERVDVNVDCLPEAHASKLRLLEVRCDPETIQRNDIEQLLSRRNILARLHGTVSDDAVDRSGDAGVGKIDLGGLQPRFGAHAAGTWVAPPYANARWVEGHWVQSRHGYYWRPGHWVR